MLTYTFDVNLRALPYAKTSFEPLIAKIGLSVQAVQVLKESEKSHTKVLYFTYSWERPCLSYPDDIWPGCCPQQRNQTVPFWFRLLNSTPI